MNFSFIFVGSTHSFIDDFPKQEKIIKLMKPEFVLSEELEDLKLDTESRFKEIFEKKFISNTTSFEDVEKLIKLCFERKISLIGIDFHNFGFDNNLQRKVKSQEGLTKEEEERLNSLIEEREEHHLSKILEYKSKTKLPLIIILGCWHLRKNSLLRKRLKNYKIIAPLDEQGEVLFEPNNKKIRYGEIISNG